MFRWEEKHESQVNDDNRHRRNGQDHRGRPSFALKQLTFCAAAGAVLTLACGPMTSPVDNNDVTVITQVDPFLPDDLPGGTVDITTDDGTINVNTINPAGIETGSGAVDAGGNLTLIDGTPTAPTVVLDITANPQNAGTGVSVFYDNGGNLASSSLPEDELLTDLVNANLGLPQTAEVVTDLPDGSYVSMVMLFYDSNQLQWVNEQDLRLHALNETTLEWELVGTRDLGNSLPTGTVGDYGIDTSSHYVWAFTDRMTRFAALDRNWRSKFDQLGPAGVDPTDNDAPIADAGADQSVTDTDDDGAESITLDGSNSTDTDGSIVSYDWTANSVTVPATAQPTVSFPVGSHVVTLTVTDDEGATGTDTVTVIVKGNTSTNELPVADAGPDQAVNDANGNGNEPVTLDGSGSTDDGSIVSYAWLENGAQIANGMQPSGVPFSVGSHTVILRVTDDVGATAEDVVTINVTGNNQAPIADAGPDQTVVDTDGNGSELINLNGLASTDDKDIDWGRWYLNGIQIASGPLPTNLVFPIGVHIVTLRVADVEGLIDEDTVVITVNAGSGTGNGNPSPIANAGADQGLTDSNGNGSETVTLDGSASTDDGTIVSYVWREGGSQIATGVQPSHTFTLGTHTVTLEVTDDQGATDTDTVVITVAGSAVANAYYVAANGNDSNPGTPAQPLRTVQAAANLVGPGDTVIINAGTYTINSTRNDTPTLRITTSGTATDRITFKSAGNGPVILDRQGIGRQCVEVMANYITLDGLEIVGGNRRGVLVAENPDNIRNGNILGFIGRNLFLHDNATGGGGEFPALHVVASTDAVIEYCVSMRNGTGFGLGLDPGSQAPPTGPDDRSAASMYGQPINPIMRYCYAYQNAMPGDEGDSDGFVLRAQGMHVSHCVAEFNSDDGFDIEDAVNSTTRSSVVEHCVSFQNGYTAGTATGNGQGFKNRFGNGFTFHHNLACFNKSIGFAEDGFDFLKGNRHYNNVAYKNGNIGFYFSSKQATAKNNVAYQNDWTPAGNSGPRDFSGGSRGPDEELKVNPNVLQSFPGGAGDQWLERPDYNYIADGDFFLNEGPNSLPGNGVSGNPRFVNPDNPGIITNVNDPNFGYAPGFELVAGSPCIDAGTDVGFPFNGSSPDMGALEK
jgi:hypothetical protein